jgi:hypothetical protein
VTTHARMAADIHPIFVRKSVPLSPGGLPPGITVRHVSSLSGYSEQSVIRFLSEYRRSTLVPDGLSLPCRPTGSGGWLYWLTSDPDEARHWRRWNRKYIRTRSGLVVASDEAMLNSPLTKGRSAVNRRRRAMTLEEKEIMESIEDALDGIVGL